MFDMFSLKIPKRSKLRCVVNRWIYRTQVWAEKHKGSGFWVIRAQPGTHPSHRPREGPRTCPRPNSTKCREGRAAVAPEALPAVGHGQRKRKAGVWRKDHHFHRRLWPWKGGKQEQKEEETRELAFVR